MVSSSMPVRSVKRVTVLREAGAAIIETTLRRRPGMKAAVMQSADSVPVYGDFPEPAAGPGSEIVELVAAGIHHLTRSVAAGRHYSRGGLSRPSPG
jgi:hypothetical protein